MDLMLEFQKVIFFLLSLLTIAKSYYFIQIRAESPLILWKKLENIYNSVHDMILIAFIFTSTAEDIKTTTHAFSVHVPLQFFYITFETFNDVHTGDRVCQPLHKPFPLHAGFVAIYS